MSRNQRLNLPLVTQNLYNLYFYKMGDNFKDIEFVTYTDESVIEDIEKMVAKDLSEPYSIFTYRYFLQNWPELSILAYKKNKAKNSKKKDNTKKLLIGVIICKLEKISNSINQGYIGMLTVDQNYRKRGIGKKLISLGIKKMVDLGATEISLETEESNIGAINLYTKLGFIKEEKLSKYYLNGGDAFRLKLWIDKNLHQRESTL